MQFGYKTALLTTPLRHLTIIHPDGLSQILQYDTYGQITNQFGAGQYPVSFHYDAAGNRTALVDGSSNRTSWNYDGRNRVTRKTYADNTYHQYSYDWKGNLRSRQDARGITTSYSYDEGSRLTRIDYPSDPDIWFEYDIVGRRTQMVDGSGTNRWYYDQAGRVLTNTQSRVNGILVYEYDVQGNRTGMSVNGSATAYGYDTAGRLNSISNAAGVFTYTWVPDANWVQSIAYPNGAVVRNAYNQLGWLSERRNLKADATVVSSFAYSYDAVGTRTNVVFADGSESAFTYDQAQQLVSARGLLSDGSVNPNRGFSYAYDSVGNRTAATNNEIITTYDVNRLNQYSSTASIDGQSATNLFAYDVNGNMTLDISPKGQTSYGWDEENRLARFTNGTHRSEFLYDGLGLLVESREYEIGSLQQTIRRVYDGFLTIADLNESNARLRDYFRGLDLSLTFDAAGGVGGLLAIFDSQTGETACCFADGNGNVVDLLASDSGSAAHYEYDPFGRVLIAAGRLASQSYQWSTKEYHRPSELAYFGYRFLNPSLGRWLSPDPLGTDPALSLLTHAAPFTVAQQLSSEVPAPVYGFVGNNPVNSLDAYGLFDFPFYGNYCGPGYCANAMQSEEDCFKCGDPKAPPKDNVDRCCYNHDRCLAKNGGKHFPCDKDICLCLLTHPFPPSLQRDAMVAIFCIPWQWCKQHGDLIGCVR